MGYRDLTEKERATRGRQLADALEHLSNEMSDQEAAKKAMKARVGSLEAEVSKLKTEVRSGKEWTEDQGSLALGKNEDDDETDEEDDDA